MIFIGIDPGAKGAIGIIDDKYGKSVCYHTTVCDMTIRADELFSILNMAIEHKEDKIGLCLLEKAQSMPKQSSTSGFNYGIGYGKILACLEILKIPFQEIHPSKWKKEFSLYKKGKEGSIKTAQQLFPTIIFHTSRGRMLDGRAEALLLAEYARRTFYGK